MDDVGPNVGNIHSSSNTWAPRIALLHLPIQTGRYDRCVNRVRIASTARPAVPSTVVADSHRLLWPLPALPPPINARARNTPDASRRVRGVCPRCGAPAAALGAVYAHSQRIDPCQAQHHGAVSHTRWCMGKRWQRQQRHEARRQQLGVACGAAAPAPAAAAAAAAWRRPTPGPAPQPTPCEGRSSAHVPPPAAPVDRSRSGVPTAGCVLMRGAARVWRCLLVMRGCTRRARP
jgi:hypothetical protein